MTEFESASYLFLADVVSYLFSAKWLHKHISGVSANNQFTDLTRIQLFIEQLDLLLELLHLQLPVRDFLSEVAFVQRRHVLVSLQIKLAPLTTQH